MPFAESSVAVFWCWVTAHLYEEEIFIDVLAVIQACCKPVLQSSPEHWGMQFAESSVAVLWCWVTAHLYEEQISIGVNAVAQGCCEPVLQSSSEQWGMHYAEEQCCSVLVLGHCTPICRANLHRCTCSDTSLLQACLAEQHSALGNAICRKQCCSFLVLGHCTPV